jgi:hypothetical protein
MNSSIKNNKRFFSLLLGLLLNSALSAVTFRNETLTNFIQTGEVLYGTIPENSLVVLNMDSNNFDIKYYDIEELDNLKEVFQQVMGGHSGCSIRSGTFNTSSNIINYNSSYLNGRECMNIQGKTSLQFINCLLESPFISITGNKMNFIDSFLINPEVLNINIDAPGSDYDMIQILFYNQPENPTVITGEIDLNNNQPTKKLIISNVKEINMKFIWDKSLPKKSDTKDAAIVDQKSQPHPTDSQFTADQIASPQIIDDAQQERNLFMSCAIPCMAGGITGYISGKISAGVLGGSVAIMTIATASTKNKVTQGIIGLAGLSAIIGTFIAENKLRAKCINWLNQNFEDCGIHKNNLTKNSARIFSWIGFLL